MPHPEDPASGWRESPLEVYAQASALYVGMLQAGFTDEAAEFAEWFLETFDLDLET